MATADSSDPTPAPVATPPSGGEGFTLCIPSGSKTYGPNVEQREFPAQGSAVTITSSGKYVPSPSLFPHLYLWHRNL